MTSFVRIQARVDSEFERNRKLHGERMKCRSGCASCCRHPFHITDLEAAQISRAVAALATEEASDLRLRASEYLEARAKLFAETGYLEARGSLPAERIRLDCPALSDATCRIYEARPLICRGYGAPLIHPSAPGRVFACELNFRMGESIPDPLLMDIQTDIADERARLELEYDSAGGKRYSEPITVAHAILEDFRSLPPF